MSSKKQDARTMFKIEFTKSSNVHMLTAEELKRLQAVELEILKDFLKVVEENNISYTLSGGSVLGTIRHGGFIPWDDDVDINMTRASYRKFCKIFAETMGNRYELWAPELGHDHGLAHVQIKKKNTVYQSFKSFTASASVNPMNNVSIWFLRAPSWRSAANVREAFTSRSSDLSVDTMIRLGYKLSYNALDSLKNSGLKMIFDVLYFLRTDSV